MSAAARPVRAVVLGYGIRGRVYARYAKTHPADLEVVGLADPVAAFPTDLNCPTWKSWEEALAADVDADAAIVSLPDRLHRDACLAALDRGLHVLLEKPIGCSWRECEEIRDAQRRARRLVLTGYVLRFAPFYGKLREIITSREIGDITSVHHLVAISYGKAAHAFCRGNWAREADGTPTLVQKCTHDFDLVEWWAKGKACRRLSSFGSLSHWRPENRPEGAADRCKDCPPAVRAACPFDAYRLYCDRKDLRYHFADESDEAMRRVVETSRYGRCVYACGNDNVDHQTVLMEYDGGLTVTIEMESYSKTRRRVTHIYGTRGEILADESRVKVRPFVGETRVVVPEQAGAHGGGDTGIMAEFVKLARSASPERYAKILEASLESHRLAFLAEESRRTGRTMDATTGTPA